MTTVANIDIGNLPNDGTGDPLRVAFAKINDNFLYLSNLAPSGPEGAIQYIKDGLSAGTANFTYDEANNQIHTASSILPTEDLLIDIGAPELRLANIYVGPEALKLGNISINEDGNTISFPITVLPSQKASLEVNNLTTDGNVTIGGSLSLANLDITALTATTTTNTANQIVWQTPAVGFNQGTFQITSRERSSTNSQSITLNVMKNNNNLTASFSAFGTVFIGTPVTRYNVDVGFGNVRVMVSPILNTIIDHTISYTINT